jgi:predicted DNA-binding protein with PD1-like motif
MSEKWEMDAETPSSYFAVEAQRGREFVIRLPNGADVLKALQQFALDKNIRFAKVHSAFMGGLQPTKFLVWTPDTRDTNNWHNETEITINNISMLLGLSGQISPRPVKGGNGKTEPFAALHFVTGGSWNCPTIGGHMNDGTIVKGVLACYITEILGIDVLYPGDWRPDGYACPYANEYPENWYQEVK